MTRNILCFLLLSFGLNFSMFIDDSCAQVKTEIAVLGFTGNALNSSDLCISCLVHDELVKTGRFNIYCALKITLLLHTGGTFKFRL